MYFVFPYHFYEFLGLFLSVIFSRNLHLTSCLNPVPIFLVEAEAIAIYEVSSAI